MIAHRFEPGAVHLLGLESGDDLYEAITEYALANDIRSAVVTFLGAVRRASLRYYNQDAQAYMDFEVHKHLEVLTGTGNISVSDGRPFLHIHAAFADDEGSAYGGHVNIGTEVFAMEVAVQELSGVAPVRELDETTGLMLWGPA